MDNKTVLRIVHDRSRAIIPDHENEFMFEARTTWLSLAIVLATALLVMYKKWAKERQLRMDLEDEDVVINTIVPGEAPIARMPGPGNQPPFQGTIGMLSPTSSCFQDFSEVCYYSAQLSAQLSASSPQRNPQGRATDSDVDDDSSDQMSTAHVPGTHSLGEACAICSEIPRAYNDQNSLVFGYMPRSVSPRNGLMNSVQQRLNMQFTSDPVLLEQTLLLEGTGEANHTFSTFLVNPRVES